jgi:uncharacterized membrane protein
MFFTTTKCCNNEICKKCYELGNDDFCYKCGNDKFRPILNQHPIQSFNKQIIDIQGSKVKFRLLPAIVCYIALIFGLYYFVINTNETREKKILNAFLLGLVIYAVYEMTTYAILKDWTIKSVLIDTIWGGVLFALTTFLVTLKLN